MKNTTTLPAMPFWQARSFWLAVVTAASMIGQQFDIEIQQEATVDMILTIVGFVTLGLSYRERANPTRSISVK